MKVLDKKTIAIIIVSILIGGAFGYFISKSKNQHTDTSAHQHNEQTANHQIWTCSMHPQVRRNEPGDCPICGMDLIPLSDDKKGQNPMAVSMSPAAMQLAGVQTLVVGTDKPTKSLRLNGKIQTDERMLFTQSTHIPGRIENLTVNFTGDYVSKGQVIANVYSPELVTAQEELFEANKIKESQPALFRAAKEKLKNWKLSDQQIDKMLTSGKTMEQFPILANSSGYVTQKFVNLGDYIQLGQPIYEISNLSKVWILFDVYESDMNWIHKGDKIEYSIQSQPGKTYNGAISYLDPVIDPKTRVAKARVEVSNAGLKLKPEMFASGVVKSNNKNQENSLAVPKSAVMWTGKRSVVYVKSTTDQGVSFMMREITLGPALGEGFIVESGLDQGEEIAVNGTFSIDAAAQLAGKPSMMNPEGGVVITGHNHGDMKMDNNSMNDNSPATSKKAKIDSDAKKALAPIFTSYFNMKSALAEDNFDKSKAAGKELQIELSKINMAQFEGAAHEIWMDQSSRLKVALEHIDHFATIDEVRNNFMAISNAMIMLAESFHPLSETVFVQHCPMANTNKGADWLSKDKEIINPYFGASMLGCGEITKTIE